MTVALFKGISIDFGEHPGDKLKDRIRKAGNSQNPLAPSQRTLTERGEWRGARERTAKGSTRGRGDEGRRGSILHGQRTISMHEAHWGYRFLSTQNTYLHFGLCTGVSC